MRALRLLIALVAALAVAVPAARAAAPSPGAEVTNKAQAQAVARRQPEVRKVLARDPHALLVATADSPTRWQVAVMHDRDAPWDVAVYVANDGRVVETYTGMAAGSFFARGHIDRVFTRWWVWLPFGLLFLLPFADPRRLRRMLHVDLAAVCSLGISYAFANAGEPETAIWLFYPPLLYLLARMLAAGWRRVPRAPRGRLVPLLPTTALLVGVVALFGARVALNVTDPGLMDIGYMSVVGADRIQEGEPLYVDGGPGDTHGDTYGPVNYLAYVPFERVLPWHGTWDSMPAAHAAALFFDLMTLIGLFVLGSRLRAGPEGRRLGLALAWAWAACPFTLLNVLQSSNDGLIAMFLVWMLVALASAPIRGALLGLAIAAKFSPAVLVPLIARGPAADGPRRWLKAGGVAAAVVVFALAVYWPAGGFDEFWSQTMGYQLSRLPDFSLWGVVDGIGWTQTAAEALAVALAVAVALVPSRRGVVEVSALAAAVLIAVQVPAGHWFYFYLTWFLPLVLVAWFAAYREPAAAAAYASGSGDSAVPASAGELSPAAARLAA